MLDFLKPYKWLLIGLVVFALIGAAAHEFNSFVEKHERIGYDKAVGEYVLAENVKLKAAAAETKRLQAKLNEAQTKGDERENKIAVLSSDNKRLSGKLRDATTNVGIRLPSDTNEAARKAVDSLATVFTDCQSRYGALAERIDLWISEYQVISDAWPSAPPE